jgi:excinuclease UvrABC nuclease subunit
VISREQRAIRVLFTRLKREPLKTFLSPQRTIDAPDRQGVYVIYDPLGKVDHVGRTLSGSGGIRQRLRNHLHGASSYTMQRLKGQGSKLRRGYNFRCLVVQSRRRRALLEAYAIGCLCPSHIGLGVPALSQPQ